MVGTYLAEYARGSALGNAVRFVSDVLQVKRYLPAEDRYELMDVFRKG